MIENVIVCIVHLNQNIRGIKNDFIQASIILNSLNKDLINNKQNFGVLKFLHANFPITHVPLQAIINHDSPMRANLVFDWPLNMMQHDVKSKHAHTQFK